jgi:hypothetical protein
VVDRDIEATEASAERPGNGSPDGDPA